jgi:ketosteroid isomerase-like protein
MVAEEELERFRPEIHRYCYRMLASVFDADDAAQDTLVALFHEDGSISMPPFVMWIRGQANLAAFYRATAHHCQGSRLLPTAANGAPAFAQYAPSPSGGRLLPWGVHVLEVRDGRIAHVHQFIDAALYPRLGLPEALV